MKPGTRGKNGWGYVVRVGTEVFYDVLRLWDGTGGLPRDLRGEEGVYIRAGNWLEILAQILALVSLVRRLPSRWLAFIDNVAGQWALTKGYGR